VAAHQPVLSGSFSAILQGGRSAAFFMRRPIVAGASGTATRSLQFDKKFRGKHLTFFLVRLCSPAENANNFRYMHIESKCASEPTVWSNAVM
jgi:hypothetical protein